jgi:hypothetical protein
MGISGGVVEFTGAAGTELETECEVAVAYLGT